MKARSVQPSFPGFPTSGRAKRSAQHKIGAAGEDAVLAMHKPAVLLKLATSLEFADQGLKPVGRPSADGTIPCRPVRKGGIDFRATLKGGRALYLEVKHISTDPPRWDLNELADHQAALLEERHQAGALCLLLVVGMGSDRFAVPWSVVARARLDHAAGTGRASLGAEQLMPWRVPTGQVYLRRFLTA